MNFFKNVLWRTLKYGAVRWAGQGLADYVKTTFWTRFSSAHVPPFHVLSFLLRLFQDGWEERLRFLGLVWLIHPVFSTARLNLVTQQWLLPENAGMKPSAPHRACHSVVPVPLLVMFELAVWMKIDMFSIVRTALELRISCFVYLTLYLAPESFSLHSDWKPNALCTPGQGRTRFLSWKVQSHILASSSTPLKEKQSAGTKLSPLPKQIQNNNKTKQSLSYDSVSLLIPRLLWGKMAFLFGIEAKWGPC